MREGNNCLRIVVIDKKSYKTEKLSPLPHEIRKDAKEIEFAQKSR
jgi:hypothetical protein